MSVYFDASLIVSLFVEEALSGRAETYVRNYRPHVAISDFARAEVTCAISRRVRIEDLTLVQARAVLADFDAWRLSEAADCAMNTADLWNAESYLRRLDLPPKTPDAVNIAIASRVAIELATFDDQMSASASLLGLRA